ncbi:response regulator transcription factor [Amycolatopsis endophytica]|uniref:DNA-binding NarL/FixJ family response regulator n=1 Tax=Amycolatopsis endophytica TaxID=860233 RepID=A0A853B072_9PSEU|nr:response regulator transcription factor [Amycolatopsis endophytica]NYI88191.1 DNA-binding NarL/FixJ family response regulator [Amycolatopsis endophytica]
MTATRVLIADDQEVVRRTVRRILDAEEDIEVVAEAADGDEAVRWAREVQPDIVLVDVRMPKRDGLSVTRLLAGPEVTEPMRVVVFTTFELDEYAHKALQNGACGFLLKRSGPTLLVEGIRAAAAGDVLISPQMTRRLFGRLGHPGMNGRKAAALSGREQEVVRLVAQARTNEEIAQLMAVSVGTVKTHLRSVQRKLRVRNRVAIAAWVWGTSNEAR